MKKIRHQFTDALNVNKNNKEERLKGRELVVSKVTGSHILFGPIQSGVMDFLMSSLTDGGRGRGF